MLHRKGNRVYVNALHDRIPLRQGAGKGPKMGSHKNRRLRRRKSILVCPHPRGAPVAPPTYFFRLYILLYPKNIQGSHETTFPPPQPSVPVRSHLGAFSGDLPEGDSITEGFYINTIASPMMCEEFTTDLRVHSY